MASPADPQLEATLRAEIDVMMKQKEALKQAISDDSGKLKAKLKEDYAKLMVDLNDASRRLINLKKDTAMATKTVSRPVRDSASSTTGLGLSSPSVESRSLSRGSSSAEPSPLSAPRRMSATLPSAEAPRVSDSKPPPEPPRGSDSKPPPEPPRVSDSKPSELAPDPPLLEKLPSVGPPDDEPPPLPEDAEPPPPPPEDDSVPLPPASFDGGSDSDEPPPPSIQEEPDWLKGVDLSKPLSHALTEQIFETFDADKNGFLDKAETSLFLTEWCNQQGVTDIARVNAEFMKRFDANGDGQITKDELLSAFKPVVKKANAEQVAKARHDPTKAAGVISATGVPGTLKEGYLAKKGAANKAFKRRYCVLTTDQLLYFESAEAQQPNGHVAISPESTVAPRDATGFWVCSTPGGRAFEFVADTSADQSAWVAAIANLSIRKSAFADSIHEGWLEKKGEKRQNMNRRYFVLLADKLCYFESLESKKLCGEIQLTSASAVMKSEEAKYGFVICPGGERVFLCEAPDANARNTWLSVLDKFIFAKVLQAAVDPKRKEGLAKGTILFKVYKVFNLATAKGFLGATSAATRLGKISGLSVSLRVGAVQHKTRPFEGAFRAVFNQVFVIPKSQWPSGTDLTCEVIDGSNKNKILGTVKFMCPEEKKGFWKGEVPFLDKSGQHGGQIEVAVIDSDVIAEGPQLQAILSPEPLTGIEQYTLGKQLGKGGCGTVYLGKHKLTNREVAIKVVAKEKEFEVRTEMDVMQMLKHPHCVKLEEMVEMKSNIYMVMELMAADLQACIYEKYNGTVPENVCRVWMKQMASALEYCHELGVVHRDIKPENLMFGASSSDIKLTDFGLATYKQAVMSESCGTPPFMAPELIMQKPYGKEVDMWALGVVVFQCLTGGMPFEQPTQDLMFIAIKRSSYTVRPEWNLSPEVVHLMKSLLEIDPKLRLTATQMLEHPWIKGEPLGDYVVPNRKEVYEALKEAQRPSYLAAGTPSIMRRRLKDEGED